MAQPRMLPPETREVSAEVRYRVVLVKFQNCDDDRCDSCGRRSVMVEVVRTEGSHDLELYRDCFSELAVWLFHTAAELRR
jgi:hypothetical protein